MKKQTIFLDIYGVLQTPAEAAEDGGTKFKPSAIRGLDYIFKNTGADIVITSSFRYNDVFMEKFLEHLENLAQYGFELHNANYDKTDDLRSTMFGRHYEKVRCAEIYDYISRYDLKSYIIIDNMSLGPYLAEKDNKVFIKTDTNEGLTSELAIKSILEFGKRENNITEINTKHGMLKLFAKTIEAMSVQQVITLASSPLGENANIRIMPDMHIGKGCVVGTTMIVTNKVCPNLVGVDIGCGVDLAKTDIDFSQRLQELDSIIRQHIPFGKRRHKLEQSFDGLEKLKCWRKLKQDAKDIAVRSLGSLGGGNHFVEAYEGGFLTVHSGSRNIGLTVAEYYQSLAQERMFIKEMTEISTVPEPEQEAWIEKTKERLKKERGLAYLEGEAMADYLHDMNLTQQFAVANRKAIIENIISRMGGKVLSQITSTHNYIDMKNKKTIILRKGAISARKGEELVIPLNMRDGLLLCVGKGNKEWNYSAPHGAGRLYSRTKAMEILNLNEYKASMEGIFSTCISQKTLDEAPFAYKDYKEIMELIKPTVEIKERLVPIYNFKASD